MTTREPTDHAMRMVWIQTLAYYLAAVGACARQAPLWDRTEPSTPKPEPSTKPGKQPNPPSLSAPPAPRYANAETGRSRTDTPVWQPPNPG
jgi:hypothetical protein